MTTAKNYLKSILCTLLALMLMLTMVSIPASAASYSLSKTSVVLTKGYATTLKVNGAGSSKVTWASADKTIATVSTAGKVVGKKAGTTTITATVNGTSLKCKVKIVGGKLSSDKKNVSVEVGGSEYVYITAKGSHGLKAVSSDTSVAKSSWVTPWDKDTIRLKIKGLSSGNAVIRVYLTNYTDIYTDIAVTVGGAGADLLTSTSLVTTKVNGDSTVMVYSNPSKGIKYALSDTTVAKITESAWNGNYVTLTVTGLKEGKTALTITSTADSKLTRTVNITVSGSAEQYYVISTTSPKKLLATDQILNWNDTKTRVTKYMLVPKEYDVAYVNTLIAKDKNLFDYYTVFDVSPTKQAATDKVLEFDATVNTKAVKRYVLVPQTYDAASFNTAVAKYTGLFSYWTIYNTMPTKTYPNDIIHSYTALISTGSVTRYVLLPFGYSEKKLEELIASDSGISNSDGYYGVYESQPPKKDNSDVVLSFYATRDGVTKYYYVLLPNNYDEARLNDIIASYKGTYEYWAIYTKQPVKLLSTDVIQSWTKMIDSKNVTRYILLPYGYSEELFAQIKDKDLGTQTSSYYIVSKNVPSKIAATDSIYQWFNAKENTYKYMLLPQNPDYLKRNDVILKDTGVVAYYTIYSTAPTTLAPDDTVLNIYSAVYGKYIYMLVPRDYSQDKVNRAMNGETIV